MVSGKMRLQLMTTLSLDGGVAPGTFKGQNLTPPITILSAKRVTPLRRQA